MIGADSSSIIAFFVGEESADTKAIKHAIESSELILPPIVVTELLSDPVISAKAELFILGLPVLEIHEGFWQRAAKTRRLLLGRRLKARLADAFIAQSCIDSHVPLITRDKDFRHYAKYCGLKLYHA